ncbi:hypothetical protein E4U54_005559 [Claviceps lovelessii]|nr:hypothetical protein E4U54_005559 [Claviceps lovelessii]
MLPMTDGRLPWGRDQVRQYGNCSRGMGHGAETDIMGATQRPPEQSGRPCRATEATFRHIFPVDWQIHEPTPLGRRPIQWPIDEAYSGHC